MLRIRRAAPIVLACAIAYAPAIAARADTPAAHAFSTGAAAYERGDFLVAAQAFDEANAIAPAPAAVYNAARAWQDAGDGPRAADRYATFLDSAPPDVPERTRARRELARLRRELLTVRIEGPPGAIVAIDHLDGATVPVRTHLRPGLRIGSWSSGTVEDERFSVDGVAGQEARIELAAPRTATQAPPSALPPRSPESPGQGANGLTVAGVTMLVVGGVVVVVGIGVGAAAVGARDDFVAGGNVDPDLRAQADDLRTASNVTWVSGAAVGAIGLVLLVTGLTQSDDPLVATSPFVVRF